MGRRGVRLLDYNGNEVEEEREPLILLLAEAATRSPSSKPTDVLHPQHRRGRPAAHQDADDTPTPPATTTRLAARRFNPPTMTSPKTTTEPTSQPAARLDTEAARRRQPQLQSPASLPLASSRRDSKPSAAHHSRLTHAGKNRRRSGLPRFLLPHDHGKKKGK